VTRIREGRHRRGDGPTGYHRPRPMRSRPSQPAATRRRLGYFRSGLLPVISQRDRDRPGPPAELLDRIGLGRISPASSTISLALAYCTVDADRRVVFGGGLDGGPTRTASTTRPAYDAKLGDPATQRVCTRPCSSTSPSSPTSRSGHRWSGPLESERLPRPLRDRRHPAQHLLRRRLQRATAITLAKTSPAA